MDLQKGINLTFILLLKKEKKVNENGRRETKSTKETQEKKTK